MTVDFHDSRRLTGPNVIQERPGAVLEITGSEAQLETVLEGWQKQARKILDAVGWSTEEIGIRRYAGGASLYISAPIDALYAATEVNEWAVESAIRDSAPDLETAAERLRSAIRKEENPRLLALRDEASRRKVFFLSDDERVSIGTGRGAQVFSVDELPPPNGIDWSKVYDIPVGLVTGTNGKTTTVRLLAAMIRAAGKVPGTTSTDGIVIGSDWEARGDYSGPEGARRVLRDPRVEVAVLETARGGLLRRGLSVGPNKVRVALVTNVGDDHLGESGIDDLGALAQTKLIVHHALGPNRRLILNADDFELRTRGAKLPVSRGWFGLNPESVELREAFERDGRFASCSRGSFSVTQADRTEPLLPIEDAPVTLGGRARYNIANGLAAILVAEELGIPRDKIARGLREFSNSPRENPGRGNLFLFQGVSVFVDFAHNPHGFEALAKLAESFEPERLAILLGQAGDREDTSIREMTRRAWAMKPDRIVIKEMEVYLRGREKGEVPALIESELVSRGVPAERIEHADSEMRAVRRALEWAQPGDLLLLLLHAERDSVLELLQRLQSEEWGPGDPIPDPI